MLTANRVNASDGVISCRTRLQRVQVAEVAEGEVPIITTGVMRDLRTPLGKKLHSPRRRLQLLQGPLLRFSRMAASKRVEVQRYRTQRGGSNSTWRVPPTQTPHRRQFPIQPQVHSTSNVG